MSHRTEGSTSNTLPQSEAGRADHAPGIFPILVAGGSGRMVPIVVDELLARGVRPQDIIVTTRTPERITRFSDVGVNVRYADFTKPHSLTDAFAEAKRCLFVSIRKNGPKPGEEFLKPGSKTEVKDEFSEKTEMQTAVNAAVEAGVEHLYYTSGISPEPGSPALWADDHYAVEHMLRKSGRIWTILRHGRQPDIFLSGMWITALKTGEYFDANAGGRNAWITREDTAAADAGALLAPASEVENRIININGPEALTSEDIMETIGRLAGRPIKVSPVEPAEVGDRIVAAGALPVLKPVIEMWARCTRAGIFAEMSDDAARLAGRRLTTMEEYLTKALPELDRIVDGMARRIEGTPSRA